jgi:hypothetical protein
LQLVDAFGAGCGVARGVGACREFSNRDGGIDGLCKEKCRIQVLPMNENVGVEDAPLQAHS